jgi:hypothetical protein
MDWLLVVLLVVQGPAGSQQTVEKREVMRSELACHTAIMRHLDTKGQRVLEAECLRARSARAVKISATDSGGHAESHQAGPSSSRLAELSPGNRR